MQAAVKLRPKWNEISSVSLTMNDLKVAKLYHTIQYIAFINAQYFDCLIHWITVAIGFPLCSPSQLITTICCMCSFELCACTALSRITAARQCCSCKIQIRSRGRHPNVYFPMQSPCSYQHQNLHKLLRWRPHHVCKNCCDHWTSLPSPRMCETDN
jgi:hypothetical protein